MHCPFEGQLASEVQVVSGIVQTPLVHVSLPPSEVQSEFCVQGVTFREQIFAFVYVSSMQNDSVVLLTPPPPVQLKLEAVKGEPAIYSRSYILAELSMSNKR